jgi:hypothetical protein
MGMFTDDTMRALLASSLETAALAADGWRDVGKGPGSSEGDFIDWLTFKDPAEAVVTDIRRIRAHPLVPNSIPIYGYVYDVRSGRLLEVPGAAVGGVAQTSAATAKAGRAAARKVAAAGKPAAAKKAAAPPKKAIAAAKKASAAASKASAATKKAGAATRKAGAAAKKVAPSSKKAGGRSAKKSGAGGKSRRKAA